VAEDLSGSSVSKTLEYACDDWCIAQIAQMGGQESLRTEYLKRAENYLNVYDEQIGYMRPRLANGEWRKDFDTINTHGQGFIEGNAWNYGLYVPQNIPHMIEMMGGEGSVFGAFRQNFHHRNIRRAHRAKRRHYPRWNYWKLCAWK